MLFWPYSRSFESTRSTENTLADSTAHIFLSQTQLAERSHQLHHQNSNTLRLQFKIPRETSRPINTALFVLNSFLFLILV